MNKKKVMIPLLRGAVTALMAVSCLTPALAASGKVTYNDVNVLLNGEQKLIAGADITSSGQKIPGSILFTGDSGDKTVYLPVETLAGLLDVNVSLDSAGKTVLLTSPSAPERNLAKGVPGPKAEALAGRQWLRELADGGVQYYWAGKSDPPAYTALPAQRPTELPEGYALNGIYASPIHQRNTTAVWTWFRRAGGETKVMTFTCYRPQEQACGSNFGPGTDTAALRREAKVQGRSADYYLINGVSNLFWEDQAGNLFRLDGPQELDQAAMEKIADSVKEIAAEPLPAYQMNWKPEGFCRSDSTAALQMAAETWERNTYPENQPAVRTTFSWSYSRGLQTAVPEGKPETVKVRGVQAQYWAGNPNAGLVEVASVGGKVIQAATAPEQTAALIWTDPGTDITFRLYAPFEKNVLIRMAESIAAK